MKRTLIFLVVGVLLFCGMKFCNRSRAETEPTQEPIIIGPGDLLLPDETTSIYDLIGTDEPTADPSDPVFTPDPDSTPDPEASPTLPPIMAPQITRKAYHNVFYQEAYNMNGNFTDYWFRLGPTWTNYPGPPFTIAQLNYSTNPSNEWYTEEDGNWQKVLTYEWTDVGITQLHTQGLQNQGQLTYVLYYNAKKANAQSTYLEPGDHISINFKPAVQFYSDVDTAIFDPVVSMYVVLDFNDTNPTSNQPVGTMTLPVQEFNLSDPQFTYDITLEHSKSVYVTYIWVYVTINPRGSGFPPEDPANTLYWFESTGGNTVFTITTYGDLPWIDKIGNWFSNLWTNIQNIFVPNQQQVQDWVTDHQSDQLESGNPINVVKDLFTNLCNTFYLAGDAQQRVVIDVPALSFDVDGQTVTPFNGYQWELGNEGVTAAGHDLWYYVKLANSVVICSGFAYWLWTRFTRWYDLHYAASDDYEGGGGETRGGGVGRR